MSYDANLAREESNQSVFDVIQYRSELGLRSSKMRLYPDQVELLRKLGYTVDIRRVNLRQNGAYKYNVSWY